MKFTKEFLIHNLVNHFAQKLVLPNGYTLAKPMNFSFTPTTRCNCKCEMCHIYKQVPTELDFDLLKETVSEIKRWLGYPFLVNFSGGEMLVYKEIYQLIEFCQRNSIYPKITTNGLLLNKTNCDALADSGLEYLSISIDSLKHEVHDHLRGIPRVLEKALQGIEYLRQRDVKIGINTVLSNENVSELPSMTKTLFELHGISRMAIQPIRPIYGTKMGLTEFKRNRLWINDQKKLEDSINHLVKLKERFNILNSREELLSYLDYFNRPDTNEKGTIGKSCTVGTTNLIVDSNGDVRFCWPLKPFGNIYDKDFTISRAWNSKQARDLRLKTIRCSENCTSRCYRSISLAQKIKYYLFLRN